MQLGGEGALTNAWLNSMDGRGLSIRSTKGSWEEGDFRIRHQKNGSLTEVLRRARLWKAFGRDRSGACFEAEEEGGENGILGQ